MYRGKYPILIIGAGPAGLSAAYSLCTKGHSVIIVEKDPIYVGGISRTVSYKGFRFDLGGHRFYTKSSTVQKFWELILGEDFLTCSRKSRILYNGRFFNYPLDIKNVLSNLGMIQSFLCLMSYIWVKIFPKVSIVSFEDWVTNQFGARLFKIFFRTYTEKVWGMPCNKISSDWASSRIKGLDMISLLKSLFFPQRVDKNGVKIVKTLIDKFRYPRLGPGQCWDLVANIVKGSGSQIVMNAQVVGISKCQEGGYEVSCVTEGKEMKYQVSNIISSMPLQTFVNSTKEMVPDEIRTCANRLSYRDFLIVVLILDKQDLFDDNWIYVHDPKVLVGRIQNFKNWSIDMVPDKSLTALGMEYFCFKGDDLWTKEDSELILLAEKELRSIGLLSDAKVIDGSVVRVPKAYPVYEGNYSEDILSIREYFKEHYPQIQFVGRNGMHFYNSQDHSMMTGFLAAENIIQGANAFDLWKVNQDAEYAEEVSADYVDPIGRMVPTIISDQEVDFGKD